MRTAFVTGGTGFIGRHLVDGLLGRGCEVRCLVRSPDRAGHLRRDGVRLVGGTLADVGGWQDAIPGCDAVFHCGGLTAAMTDRELFAVNAAGVGALADACRRPTTPPRFVYVSSLAAAGPPPPGAPRRTEADPSRPVSQYGRSKLGGEEELRRRAADLPATIVRPGAVFGIHDPKTETLYQMIARMRLHVVMGLRSPPLSLIHVDDVVALLLAAADRGERLAGAGDPPHHGTYTACDDREHPTYADFGRRIARAIDRRALVLPIFVPVALPVTFVVAKFWNVLGQPSFVSPDKLREATAPSWAASGGKAREQLGFAPTRTLDEGLRHTGAWLRDNGRL